MPAHESVTSGVRVFLLIYVDDILLASTDRDEISRIKLELSRQMKLSSLGQVSYFLGIRVTQEQDGFYCMDQETYIRKIASRYELGEAKGSKQPMDVAYYQSRQGSKKLPNNKRYQSLIGALLYVAVNTRPDVTASIAILGRQVSDPTEADWAELKRVVRYLNSTGSYKLKLSSDREKPLKLFAYCDADWGSDTKDRKSNTGFVFILGQSTVC